MKMTAEEFKKSLLAKGMSEADADDVCKGFPFGDGDDKEPDNDKDDKSKTEKATPSPEDLEKSVGKLKALLEGNKGLSEEEVNERIEKAVAAVKTPLEQHAVAISQVTDALLKANEAEVEGIKKSVSGLIDAVQGLAANQKDLNAALTSITEKLEKSVGALDAATAATAAHLEEVKKSVAQPAAEQPRSVQTEAEVVPHAGDAKKPTALWTKDEVLKKAVEISQTNEGLAHQIRVQMTMVKRNPDAVAKEFGLTK